MTKTLATSCVVGALLLSGCGDGGERAAEVRSESEEIATELESGELECRADDDSWLSVQFSPATQDNIPFRCLRFADAGAMPAGSRELRIVNINASPGSGAASNGQLHIALHEIKAKGFLKGRELAIVSDGKRFGAIERECAAMRDAGIGNVVALLAEPDPVGTNARMSAKEFISERAYGVWRFVNLSSKAELESPLFATGRSQVTLAENRGGRSGTGLVRTLVVFDNDTQEAVTTPAEIDGAGQVFVLDGGLEGLEQYEAEAEAMARALARPRIGERGCAG